MIFITLLFSSFQTVLQDCVQAPELTLEQRIVQKSIQYGIPPEKSLRIANCESSMNPLAKNPNSSAKGLYQFIDSTWEHYCEGDVLNADDNIDCFVKLYPKHKDWWICK